jgi:hypothetical protein
MLSKAHPAGREAGRGRTLASQFVMSRETCQALVAPADRKEEPPTRRLVYFIET